MTKTPATRKATTQKTAKVVVSPAIAEIAVPISSGRYFGGHRMLEEGAVVDYEKRVWRVGLVNESRARLDPVTGSAVVADPVSGRSFISYGGSINISPKSTLAETDLAELDESAIRRLTRLMEMGEIEKSGRDKPKVRQVSDEFTDDEEGDNVAAVASEPVPMPVATKTKAELNKERLAKLAKSKGVDTSKAATKKVKVAKDPQPCKCGCGGKTGGYFVPGHDASFKGKMLQVERGKAKKEELFTPEVIAAYKWVKVKGGAERTTTNYKGESHTGYDKNPPKSDAAAE